MIRNKYFVLLLGVLAMFGSLLILLVLPITDLSKIRGGLVPAANLDLQ